MNRRVRCGRTAALGATIAIIAVVVPAARVAAVPAARVEAASAPACTTKAGVTVIVDFTYFSGGRIERGCAPGHPANGLAALTAAGFRSAGTAQYGDAFVCRIDGLPKPKDESCAVTPSATSYWSYYHARPSDAQWTYSSVGVLDYHPPVGSIEAFAFGARALPGISPAAALPTPTPTTPPASSPAHPTTTTPAPPVSAATAPTSSSIAPPAPTTAPSTTAAPTTPASAPGTTVQPVPPRVAESTTTTRAAPRVVDRTAARAAPHDDPGSPAPAIVTILVVGSLGAFAFVITRARRRRAA